MYPDLGQEKQGTFNLIDWLTMGRVGNSESGEAYRKTQSVPETNRVEDTGTYIYLAWAIPGTVESVGKWKIARLDASGNKLWADGNALYDNVWDDRATLDYK